MEVKGVSSFLRKAFTWGHEITGDDHVGIMQMYGNFLRDFMYNNA